MKTIARLTLSSLLRGWRGILLALLPVATLLLSVAARSLVGGDTDGAVNGLLANLVMGTTLPLTLLIIGTGSISTEIDDGSIVYLLTKPVPRELIAVTKIGVAVGVSVLFGAVPVFLSALILTGSVEAVTMSFLLASLIACVVYCTLFVLLGVISRQAVMVGLLYILLWESLIAGLVPEVRVLSVRYWATSLVSRIAPDTIPADVNLVVAAVLAVLATVGGVYYAGRRLRSLTLAGES